MGRRNGYSVNKRRREQEKLRKRREKRERRARNREDGGGAVEIATAESIQGGDLRSEAEVLADVIGDETIVRSAPALPVRLFVGGLSWGTDVDGLRAAFDDHVPVLDAVVVKDPATGDSRGFGFVTIAGQKEAVRATRKLDGSTLDGRTIAVRPATERH
jgi:RNA recognition motif-containing protein